MKKVLTVAAVALMMAGSTAFACSSCGCTAKKEAKTECKKCTAEKKCEACTAKKAEKTNTCSSCTAPAK